MSGTEASLRSSETTVLLRGTGHGLEIDIVPEAPLYDVIAELEARFAQSPSFFSGNEATISLGGRQLPPGGLAHLKAVTDRYGLRIVALRSEREEIQQAASNLQIPIVAGAVPSAAPSAAPPIALEGADSARLVTGPVRSGGLFESPTHLVVIGDVNPGAEVRAGGNIVVLGSLRGLAHAACGGSAGYILALRLDAQQLRIGALIARAGEVGPGARAAEIAYAADGRIIVEPYQGKLPAMPVKR